MSTIFLSGYRGSGAGRRSLAYVTGDQGKQKITTAIVELSSVERDEKSNSSLLGHGDHHQSYSAGDRGYCPSVKYQSASFSRSIKEKPVQGDLHVNAIIVNVV
jgi:hypothetical protein